MGFRVLSLGLTRFRVSFQRWGVRICRPAGCAGVNLLLFPFKGHAQRNGLGLAIGAFGALGFEFGNLGRQVWGLRIRAFCCCIRV